MITRGRSTKRHGALLLLGLSCTGCATTLDLRSQGDPKVPTATIYYTGVRGVSRRFPDYGSVDRSILAPPANAGRP